MSACHVCGGSGEYLIIDNFGVERYSIQCPECYGSGEVDKDVIAEEQAAAKAEHAAAVQRDKYERAMAEKRAALAKEAGQ